MREVWVGRYPSLVPIRCRGALHFYSAREPESDRPRVLVMAPRIPAREARARLGGLARAHRAISGAGAGEHVPAVVDQSLDGPAPWVALDCDAIADLEHASDFVQHDGDKLDFERGAALGKTIMETLIATHRVRDSESRRPMCLGSLAPGNLLFAADGKLWLVGFGAGPLSNAVIAPEVATGAPPTPGADAFAVTLFLRAQAGFVELPPALRRVVAGHPRAGDAELMRLFVASNLKFLAATPPARPDVEALLAEARELWRLLGLEPDVAGFAAWMARALAVEPERLADAPRHVGAPRICLGRDAEWLETPNGMRHSLGARRPLRRLLLALAEARRDRAGAALTVEDLLQAGWPGEDPLPEAGSNRVYVAVSTLRKLGLGELLQRWDGGYRLDPTVHCQL